MAQRARDAFSLIRAFLLLEDGDPVDWEVGQEECAEANREPAWARTHRTPLCGRRTPRRGGRPAPSPQPCLSPVGPTGARPAGAAPRRNSAPKRGSRIKSSAPGAATARHGDFIAAGR